MSSRLADLPEDVICDILIPFLRMRERERIAATCRRYRGCLCAARVEAMKLDALYELTLALKKNVDEFKAWNNLLFEVDFVRIALYMEQWMRCLGRVMPLCSMCGVSFMTFKLRCFADDIQRAVSFGVLEDEIERVKEIEAKMGAIITAYRLSPYLAYDSEEKDYEDVWKYFLADYNVGFTDFTVY